MRTAGGSRVPITKRHRGAMTDPPTGFIGYPDIGIPQMVLYVRDMRLYTSYSIVSRISGKLLASFSIWESGRRTDNGLAGQRVVYP